MAITVTRRPNSGSKFTWKLGSTLLTLGLVLAACSSGQESSDSGSDTTGSEGSSEDNGNDEANGEPITIGSIFDLTGGLNIYGIQQDRTRILLPAIVKSRRSPMCSPMLQVAGL